MSSAIKCLEESIANEDFKVFSFDIFDTVLTRATGTPMGLFQIMQDRIVATGIDIPADLAEDFYRVRHNASKKARDKLQKECNIYDIYSYIQDLYDLTDKSVEQLISLEIDIEIEHARPISDIIRILGILRSKKKRIIFITDMYLPKAALIQMLKKVGAYSADDAIYVSHDFRKTKKHGDLYPVVLHHENCAAGQVLHIGDNKRADYTSARKCGVHAILFSESHINRHERILLNYSAQQSPLFSEKLCGAARQARFSRQESSKHQQTLHRIGANVAGPILLLYVQWILQEAERNNLRRLYFLARDGQILLHVARKIYKLSGFSGELRYLYASRQALYLPATTQIDNKIINWILLRKQFLSLAMIANRTGLPVELLQTELKKISGTYFSADYNFNTREIELLKGLLKVPRVSKEILNRAAEWRANARHYLEQEGLFEDIPYGVVDLGVKGTLQDCIKDILLMYSPDRENELYGFYFGVNRFGKITGKYKKKFGYLFAPDCQQKHCPVSFSATRILEIFTTGDHGLTLAYERKDNSRWGPLLKEEVNTDILQWGLLDLRGGVDAFLDALLAMGEQSLSTLNPNKMKSIIIALLSSLANRPELYEAEALGDHPFKNDPVESYTITFAPAFDLNTALTHIKNLRSSELTSWIEGTSVRSKLLAYCILQPLRLVHVIKEGVRKGVRFWYARKSQLPMNHEDMVN